MSLQQKTAALFFCVLISAFFAFAGTPGPEKTQRSIVSGSFYPGDPQALGQYLDVQLREAVTAALPGEVRALIVPHAGYAYSGAVAASGYRALGQGLKNFIILAVNHNGAAPPFKAALSDSQAFETPLGKVKVSSWNKEIAKDPFFKTVPEAYNSHVIEVQLPFLQRRYKDLEILPIVLGDIEKAEIEHVAKTLLKYIDKESAIIVSSDLSHYYPYETAQKLDKSCIKSIESQSTEEVSKCEACGIHAIMVLLDIAKKKRWTAKILDYRNSGDTSGIKSQVVGYSAIAFSEETGAVKPSMSPSVQGVSIPNLSAHLLKFSRKVLEDYVRTGKVVLSEEEKPLQLLEKQGCFVTLKKNGQLRGCIGSILPEQTLLKCVEENTINAAARDFRFDPVQVEELSSLEIEISLLTIPAAVGHKSPSELLGHLVPMKHGVILKRGIHSATYLPQVWEELPVKEEFLGTLCMKGRMQSDCWKDPDTEVLTYEARVFKEAELRSLS